MLALGFIFFILIGIIVGSLGTLIGAGGGFLLIPLLLFLYPDESPEVITAISLAIVFVNSLSGTIAYIRKRRVDFRSGIIFSIASIPGSIIGAQSISSISRATFEPIFGMLLLGVGVYLFRKSRSLNEKGNDTQDVNSQSYSIFWGCIVSLFVGFIASFLGIGGGIIHVPLLVYLFSFPVHRATATSHFIIAIVSLIATLVHLSHGTLASVSNQILFIGVGALIGAQVGAKLSMHINGRWIMKGLALALLIAGIRLLVVYC